MMWSEENSETFIDYGEIFVPERAQQVDTFVKLLPPDFRGTILELGCGEGILAEAYLTRFSECAVIGLDGSANMRQAASRRNARFEDRFQTAFFDLASTDWREQSMTVDAVVSSLVIHHLDDNGKRRLFHDIHSMLSPGGLFAICDVVKPATDAGWRVAADAWDAAVKAQALSRHGDTELWKEFDRLGWNMYRYFDPDDIDILASLTDQLKWLSEAGFIDVDLYWMRAGHALLGGWKAVSNKAVT
jgi:tRNA (cmo5U34)-methyltransferase